jgi:hypothetical protein
MPQVAAKDFERMLFGALGQFTANFPIQAGQHQSLDRVLGAFLHEVGEGMFDRDEGLGELRELAILDFGFDPNPLGTLGAIDGQDAIGGQSRDGRPGSWVSSWSGS